MSLDYWHLSMATVQLALRNHGFEYKPVGTSEFRFRVGKDWYYIFCANLPRLYIERIEDVREFLGENFSSVDLFSAINAVNDKYHLVKVSRADEFILRFTHCLKEDRYLNFKADLPEYIRELDDALESFKMGCRIIQESNDEPMKDYNDRMMDADDDMYKVKRTQS